MAGLSWPLYIGGQVSRIWSGSIQITVSVYDIISYFDYIYAQASLTGPRGTKIMGLISYTLVTGKCVVDRKGEDRRNKFMINGRFSITVHW
jgi:hypothetical protein